LIEILDKYKKYFVKNKELNSLGVFELDAKTKSSSGLIASDPLKALTS